MVAKTRLGATGSSVTDMGNMGALTPILGQLAGGTKRGQMAIDFAQQLYPEVEKADPYEAALQYFLEMGRQASQPGATVLGSAVGAMQAPADYLAAKKKEKKETDRARMQTALQLAPSLKPPTVTKAGYTNVMVDGVAQVMTPSEIQAAKAAGKTVAPYEKPSTSLKLRHSKNASFSKLALTLLSLKTKLMHCSLKTKVGTLYHLKVGPTVKVERMKTQQKFKQVKYLMAA